MPGRAITQICPQCQMPLVLPATFVGKSVPCTRCGASVQVGDAAPALSKATALPVDVVPPHLAAKGGGAIPPPAASFDPRPPHLQAATADPMAADGAVEADDVAASRPAWLVGCYVVSIMLIVGVTGMAIIVAATLVARGWSRPAAGENGDLAAGQRRLNPADYTDASRKSVTYSGLLVRIDRVEVGKVRYRSRGEVLETATPNYLMVTLTVKNRSLPEPIEYKSWHSYTFGDDEEGYDAVELLDDSGRELPLFQIPGADTVERHIASDVTLALEEETRDTLVFKLPDGYLDDPIPPLYLSLPAAAFGNTGMFRFHIPATMIVRREN
jgi:hypothetical protein